MGDRAVVTFKGSKAGVYLHWHGSKETVEAFLTETKAVMKGREGDVQYATARFIAVCASHISGNLSLGVGALSELDCDNGNNGLYICSADDFTILERKYHA